MRKFITIFLVLFIPFILLAEAADFFDIADYYSFQYPYLEGMEPYALMTQSESQKDSKFWFYQGAYSVNPRNSFMHLAAGLRYDLGPLMISFNGKILPLPPAGELILTSPGGYPFHLFHENYEGIPQWGVGGEVLFKDYLSFSFLYNEQHTFYTESIVYDWGLNLYPRDIFSNSYLPKTISVKALQDEGVLDGFVIGSFLDNMFLDTVSFGYTEKMDRYFATLYGNYPFGAMYAFSLKNKWISETPYIRSIEASLGLFSDSDIHGNKSGMGREIYSIAIGYSLDYYTDQEMQTFGLTNPQVGSVTLTMNVKYGGSDDPFMFGLFADMWALYSDLLSDNEEPYGVKNLGSSYISINDDIRLF